MSEFIPIRPGSRVGHIVDDATGCWLWTGAKATTGYGRVGVPMSRKTAQAHRVYYERAHGPVDRKLDLDHLCRNRGCVNPKHLEPVPRHINAWRGIRTKLVPMQVRAIRAQWTAGGITLSQLGRRFGVHAKTISDIVTRENWAAVS